MENGLDKIKVTIQSTLTTKGKYEDLKLAEVNFGKEIKKFWYVGKEKDFLDLIKETFVMTSYQAALTDKEMVIMDVGAFIGDTAYAFSPYASKIYSFEPNPDAFECLKRNIEEHRLDKVTAINRGLGAYTGKERLYTGTTINPFRVSTGGYEIDIVSLDDFFDEYKIEHVDLLKIDIEGYEYEVLESNGFKKVVDKIGKIVLESHPFFLPGIGGGTIWKLPYILSKYGFVTKTPPGQDIWQVKTTYSDGSTNWVPMRIFLAEKEKK